MKVHTWTCKAIDCQHVISTRMLMCLDHWRMVPAPLRREITDLVKGRRLHFDKDAHARYQDALRRAVAAVEEKQGRKASAAAGLSGSLFT